MENEHVLIISKMVFVKYIPIEDRDVGKITQFKYFESIIYLTQM